MGAVSRWRSADAVASSTAQVSQVSYVRQAPAAKLPPPVMQAGVLGWLRTRLFSTPGNAALTVVCGLLLAWAAVPLVRFLVLEAVWSGDDRTACLASPANPDPGACWAFSRAWFSFFIYGFYPISQRWRVDVFFVALAVGIAWLLAPSAPRRG